MVNINRVRAEWNGFPGAPGVSTFYSTGNVEANRVAVYNLFNAMKAYLPMNLDVTVATSGEVIDPVSGDLVSLWAESAAHVVSGTNSGGYAAPVGFAVNWFTGTVINGHVLRGRTYFVPCTQAIFQTDGTILDATLVTLRAAADAYVTETAGAGVVWSRPTTSHSGGFSAITDGDVSDMAVVLRSRRD